MLAFKDNRFVWAAISVINSVASLICFADWFVKLVCFCTSITDCFVCSLIAFNSSRLLPAVSLYSSIFSELAWRFSTFAEVSSNACPISATCWFALIVSSAWLVAPEAISSTAVFTLSTESVIFAKDSANWLEKPSSAFAEDVMFVRISRSEWIKLWIALAISPTSSPRSKSTGFISNWSAPFATLPRFDTAPSILFTIRFTIKSTIINAAKKITNITAAIDITVFLRLCVTWVCVRPQNTLPANSFVPGW